MAGRCASCRGTGGVDSANSFFYIKQKYCIHQHAFLCSNIQHSTFHQPQAGPPLSPERETYGMLLFIQLLHSCLLRRGKSATCYRYSYTLTYRILLSPTSQRLAVRPFSPERETFCMLSLSATFSFGIKKHTKCPITPDLGYRSGCVGFWGL